MTRDTVERAIKRGAGELEGQQLETILYEGYTRRHRCDGRNHDGQS